MERKAARNGLRTLASTWQQSVVSVSSEPISAAEMEEKIKFCKNKKSAKMIKQTDKLTMSIGRIALVLCMVCAVLCSRKSSITSEDIDMLVEMWEEEEGRVDGQLLDWEEEDLFEDEDMEENPLVDAVPLLQDEEELEGEELIELTEEDLAGLISGEPSDFTEEYLDAVLGDGTESTDEEDETGEDILLGLTEEELNSLTEEAIDILGEGITFEDIEFFHTLVQPTVPEYDDAPSTSRGV